MKYLVDIQFRKFDVPSISSMDKFSKYPVASLSRQVSEDLIVSKFVREVELSADLAAKYKTSVVYVQDFGIEKLKPVLGCSIDAEDVEQFLQSML